MIALLIQLLQGLLIAAAAPFATGLVRFTRARLQGRRGASPLQPYRDLWRLVHKTPVVPDTATWLFRAAPYVVLALVWLAASLVPTFSADLALAPAADLIALVGLLGAARMLTVLAALDAGAASAGIGAGREMLIASLAEPTMLMVSVSLAMLAGTTRLAGIVDFMLGGHVGLQASVALALGALVLVAVAESGRVDDPATLLELTAVHEAMVLEHSGRHLAMMDLANMLRLCLFMALIVGIFVPWGIGLPGAGPLALLVGLGLFAVKLAVACAALATVESAIARLRVFRVSDLMGGALLLALLAAIFLAISGEM